ncbi:hypothetical protein [Nocardiopsis suaedae]|uniref:DUF2007 domain-containing protein n=1 Tax=Nocardiopsis suaedae TaxID=3018444 RepID=A0ABT4TPH2_9ACTN|nr:hypothetical protein [Nocardiopsis suaedae]MDA2806579.1 hypothetical protein [Nocardiopsis suaedae]
MTHRRGNGLLADAYVPLILLPPASADLMLEALGRAGIAAYAIRLDAGVPDASPEAGATATDHLYVDEREREAAEQVLRAELPDLEEDAADRGAAGPAAEAGDRAGGAEAESGGARDEDDVWADLVARFYESGTEGDDGPPAWPDAENVAPRRTGRAGATDPAAEDTAPSPIADDEDEDEDAAERRGGRAAEDDGDHFVPPPPPPLPRGDMLGRLAWGGLFGGPAVLLVSMLMGTRPGWLAFCAVAAFIAGFVVLVVRMGDRASGDNGPDDGAVV